MRKHLLVIILMAVVLSFHLAFVEAQSSVKNQQTAEYDCNVYKTNITMLEQDIKNLTQELEYCKNLTDYYRALYESKDANITNREIIETNKQLNIIYQNISNIYQKIENIKNSLTIFSLEFGASIFGGVTLIEVVLYFSRRKKHDKT